MSEELWSPWIEHKPGDPCPIPWAEGGQWQSTTNGPTYAYTPARRAISYTWTSKRNPDYRYRVLLSAAPAGWAPPGPAAQPKAEEAAKTINLPVAQRPTPIQPSAHEAGEGKAAPEERPVSNRCQSAGPDAAARVLATSAGRPNIESIYAYFNPPPIPPGPPRLASCAGLTVVAPLAAIGRGML